MHSDAKKMAVWQNKLGTKTKKRVGIVWTGSRTHRRDHSRSIALSELLAQLPKEFEYISLQKEIRHLDKTTLEDITHFEDEIEDFTDTAALCDLVDLVITVDTSVAHLSGALGKPTWLLLSYTPDWRWLLDRSDSPWYPCIKLYRQKTLGNWVSVLEKVKQDMGML